MGVKMGWIQIEMGHPLARNGAALAPFRANGAHPSYYCKLVESGVHNAKAEECTVYFISVRIFRIPSWEVYGWFFHSSQ